MSPVRVLRVYHSAVVDEYRQRERMLRRNHGYDVHLVCPPAWPEGSSIVTATADPEIPVHIIETHGPRHPILFWYAARPFREALRRVRPQIVDLHEEPYSLSAAVALHAIRREVPEARVCIYTAQNINKRYPPPFRQLERRALLRAEAAYPCSTEAGEVLRSKGFRGSLHVLPLGVTPTGHGDPEICSGMRLGFVGRLEPYKGGDVAIRAFAEACRNEDASLEFVGSGPQADALQVCARQLGVEQKVRFAGALPQEETLRRIASYDVLLVPSMTTSGWKEQFGRVAAQAMASGTAVIASDSGALPEVLGECGELVPEGDVSALAAAIERLMRDPERREHLGTCGRRRAEDHLSWEQVARGCDRMYSEVLDS